MMPTNDPDLLRAALDRIANALQPAALITGRLHRVSAEAAEDAATVDNAITQAVKILKIGAISPRRVVKTCPGSLFLRWLRTRRLIPDNGPGCVKALGQSNDLLP
jgi:hypothetical protein